MEENPTVADAVIETLVDHDITTVFGIPGKQTLPLNEAIDESAELEFVVARHETAVTHQAWGYAETSGRVAATMTIPGPGDMNAMNGLKNALNDCTPLLHLAVETSPEIRGGEGIHETPPDTYDNVVKENILVTRPERAAVAVARGIEIALTPPMGPVRVGLPKNFLAMDTPVTEPELLSIPSPATPDADAVDDAATILESASEPVIITGGGVRSASATEQLTSLAERLDAPIVTTYKGKGTVAEDHPLYAGTLSGSASPELLDCLGTSDVGLAVGTDFDAVATRAWSVQMPTDLLHVTLDPDDLGNGYNVRVGLVGDAGDVLSRLEERLVTSDRTGASTTGTERAADVREATRRRLEPLYRGTPPLTSVEALRSVRSALPRETIVSADAGGFRVWALNAFAAYGPRSYVNPGSWATMGTGLPAGIGAQLTNPEADVAVLTGDGGLLMCLHELHTVVSERLPVTIVAFNNSDYAIISEDASRNYDLPEQAYGWASSPIDLSTVAEGMGLTALSAETPEEVETAVEQALDADEPVLVEVATDPREPQASDWMRAE